MRRVYALQFDLVTRPPRFTSVIVWPDQPVGRVHPANEQDFLDVRAGDVLLLAGRRRTVEAVRIYRGDGAANTAPVVECGRAWITGASKGHPHGRLRRNREPTMKRWKSILMALAVSAICLLVAGLPYLLERPQPRPPRTSIPEIMQEAEWLREVTHEMRGCLVGFPELTPGELERNATETRSLSEDEVMQLLR